MSEAEAAAARINSIFVYPIKSCRGISVSQAPLTSNGLRWDRLWMVVNSKGRMCTQRVEPKLALIQVELPTQAFEPSWQPNTTTSFLVLKAPGMNNEVKIPLVEAGAIANGVSVWNWSGSAFDEGDEAAKWLSEFLGKPSRLVRFNEASEIRPAMSDYAKSYTIRFNDWYPFHLISQESLNALNDRLSEPILINRFRANFIVDGCEPFSEDLWNEIKINDFTFRGGELCYRCKIPTVDQETAAAGSEPTRTLATFRSDKVLRPNKEKHQGRVYMGQMLVCTNYTPEESRKLAAIIRVGDAVHVLKSLSSYDHCIL